MYDTAWYNTVEYIRDTLIIRDTIYQPADTIYSPSGVIIKDIDTLAILRDYFSVYRYRWEKQDSNLQWRLNTTISQNKPLVYDLSYKILRPQTVINNTYYSKSLLLGLDVPLYKASPEVFALYSNDKYFGGVGYSKDGFSIKGGIKLKLK